MQPPTSGSGRGGGTYCLAKKGLRVFLSPWEWGHAAPGAALWLITEHSLALGDAWDNCGVVNIKGL